MSKKKYTANAYSSILTTKNVYQSLIIVNNKKQQEANRCMLLTSGVFYLGFVDFNTFATLAPDVR